MLESNSQNFNYLNNKMFIEEIVESAFRYTNLARRKTISLMDILLALKHNGKTLYGFPETQPLREVRRKPDVCKEWRQELSQELHITDYCG